MKNSHFLLALAAAACLTFTGCKKNNTDESPAPSSTIKDFFEKTEVKSQTFTINTDNGQSSITGDQGTIVTFPENAFTTLDGSPITGTVSIELKEIYDKSDMVLSDRPTTSDGRLLLSGGEIFISATANGQELKLDSNTNILIELAQTTDIDSTMGLFTGGIDSIGFNWTPVDIDSSRVVVGDSNWERDTIPCFYYDPAHYIYAISTLGWINCDRFYDNGPSTNIHITCNGDPTTENTRVFIIFKNLNSVSSLWVYNSTFDSGMLPVGEDITLIALGIKDGQEYFSKKDITISSDLNVSMDLAKASTEDITTTLEHLN